MARHAHEFSCTNCSFWNYPMLSEGMTGNYIIKCGNCGHEHYRTIKKGVVTEDRHNTQYKDTDLIHVMPSACSKEKRAMGKIAQLRAAELAGVHT